MRDARGWDAQSVKDLSKSRTPFDLNRLKLIIIRICPRERREVRVRRRLRVRRDVIEFQDFNFGNGTSATMVLDSEVVRDIRQRLSLDSDQHCRIVHPSKTNRINSVRVGKRDGRINNAMSVPMFQREVRNREGSKNLMREQEAVVAFIMPLKVDSGLPANEGPIVDRVLPVIGRGENSKLGTAGGREERDTSRTTAESSSLVDVRSRSGKGRVKVSEGKVVKVCHGDERHVDIDIVRSNGNLKVLGVKEIGEGIRGRWSGTWVRHRDEPVSLRSSECRRSRRIVLITGAPKDELLGVVFFLPIDVLRVDEAAVGAAVVVGEAKGAEEPLRFQNQAVLNAETRRGDVIVGHGRAGSQERSGVRWRRGGNRVRRRRRELTLALDVIEVAATAAPDRVPANGHQVVGGQAAVTARNWGEWRWSGARAGGQGFRGGGCNLRIGTSRRAIGGSASTKVSGTGKLTRRDGGRGKRKGAEERGGEREGSVARKGSLAGVTGTLNKPRHRTAGHRQEPQRE
jgi:hypothetical protein